MEVNDDGNNNLKSGCLSIRFQLILNGTRYYIKQDLVEFNFENDSIIYSKGWQTRRKSLPPKQFSHCVLQLELLHIK